MDLIKTYGKSIEKHAFTKPETSLNMIKLGLLYEQKRLSTFPNKKVPAAYQKLNYIAVNSLYTSLKEASSSAWVNIFAPVELLQNFSIHPMSIECFSSFMGGFKCEDFFIDQAEKAGIAETLCSYHKAFLGAGELGILPKPSIAITTSMICDGNINTFRYLCDKYNVALYILDIPYSYSKETEEYVVLQLKELISMLEDQTHKKLNMDELKLTLTRENKSKTYFKQFLKASAHKYYPSTLSLQMFMLFASHLSIGTQDTLDFYKLLSEDVQKYPDTDAHKVFWVHLMPYYHKVLGEYFNFSPNYQIAASDINLDYMEPLDTADPLHALAKKLILNIYNGSFERKATAISKIVNELDCNSVIDFCHWGCKQSAGGVMILKNELKKSGIPTLVLDGDGIDRRNSPEGQIKTRLEAFFEMIEKQKGDSQNDRLCM